MNVGSLFSGIGGLDLGLERAGMHIVWQVECDPYARAVLRKHWPDVPCYGDVRQFRARDAVRVDLICGGFPCQDISGAGHGEGLAGERSGLWFHFARILAAAWPEHAIIESTPPFLRWVPLVRRYLRSIGYASVPLQLRAADVGAPHVRKRLFVLAHAPRDGRQPWWASHATEVPRGRKPDRGGVRTDGLAYSYRLPVEWLAESWGERPAWPAEPDVGRVANGVPSRVDRLRCLGNAVVPQVAEYIGRLILAHAEGSQMTSGQPAAGAPEEAPGLMTKEE